MIVGLGLDTVAIARIESAMQNPRFLARILTHQERTEANPVHRVASRWAAKEATAKALGTHLRWHEVELLHEANGRPFIRLNTLAVPHPPRIHVSLTHDGGLAIAVVIAEHGD